MLIAFFLLLGANIFAIVSSRRKRLSPDPKTGKPSSMTDLAAGMIAADAIFIGFIVFLCCMFDMHWYNKVLYVLLGLLAEGLLAGLMTGRLNVRLFLIWCACTFLAAGGLYASVRYDRYLKDITLPEHFSYASYVPFTEGTLANPPDEPASLRFDDPASVPRMDGATALYPVYAAFAQAVYPPQMAGLEAWEITDIVRCSTTASAYRSIADGTCDSIFAAGPSAAQEAYAAEKGADLVYTPIGREAFVFFVHPDNPLSGLTLDQIRGIYSGEITSWDQLGVPGLGRILAYQREEGSGSQTALQRFVMRDTPLMPADRETHMDGMGDIVESVSAYKNHRNAIGFSFRFYCTALMKNFDVKLLAVNGVEPTTANIENGTYPLASSFYAVTRADADENTQALLSWILDPQGQALIEKTGYTPIGAGGGNGQ